MLERLGFSTDAPDEWAALPDPLTLYRAGDPGGSAWSTDRAVVERWADGTDEIVSKTVPKSAALAYIAGRGEAEVLLRRVR